MPAVAVETLPAVLADYESFDRRVAGQPESVRALRRAGRERFAEVGDGERPNVLIYLVDTLRRDRLGVYGYDRPVSPELDRFVAEVRQRSAAVLGGDDIDARVTGFAVTYQVTAPAIRRMSSRS